MLMQALAQLPADLWEMLTPVRKLVVRKTGRIDGTAVIYQVQC